MYKEYPLCPFAYYDKQKNGLQTLKCNKTNKLCAYSRYCSLLLKVVHTSAYMQCVLKNSKG